MPSQYDQLVADVQPPSRSWRDHAVCDGAPLHVFFPDSSPKTTRRGTLTASLTIRTYCARCPVRDDCLAAHLLSAADNAELTGIRGGVHFPGGPRTRMIQAVIADLVARQAATPSQEPQERHTGDSNRAGRGNLGGHGPDLQTGPYARRAPVSPAPRTPDTPRRRVVTDRRTRWHADLQAARQALTDHGSTWRDARTWAITHGVPPADVATLRPQAVWDYLAAHPEPRRTKTQPASTTGDARRDDTYRALRAHGISWKTVQKWALDNGYTRAETARFNPQVAREWLTQHAPNDAAEAPAC